MIRLLALCSRHQTFCCLWATNSPWQYLKQQYYHGNTCLLGKAQHQGQIKVKLTGHSELGRSPAFIGQEHNFTSIFHFTLSDDHGMLLARACDGDSITGFHFFFIFQPSDILAIIVQLHAEDGCII